MAITQVSNSLVKQDLTIVGGTVDNTVIGSGTPAAGTFTTVAGALASTVTGTTAAASDNSTKIATTAYVTTALANLVDSAPGTLNTLNELAAALGDDASFSTTVTTSIAAKLPLAGGTMSGALNMGSQNITNAGTIAGTLTTAAQTNITSLGTLTGLTTSGSVGFRVAADSNYAFVALQNSSLTHGGYMSIQGGTATGLEINASASSFSGTILLAKQSQATSGGYLARFANSAGDKVVINTAGNVGIGTASPSSALHVDSSNDGPIFDSGGTGNTNHALLVRDSANNQLLRVNNDGNVGIGLTTGISSKLHVNNEMSMGPDAGNRGIINYSSDILSFGTRQSTANYFSTVNITSGKVLIGDNNSHTTDPLQIETPASGGGQGIQIRRNDSNASQGIGHLLFGNNTATNLAKVAAGTDGHTDDGYLMFATKVNNGSLTDRLMINSRGNFLFGGITSETATYSSFVSGQQNRILELSTNAAVGQGGSTIVMSNSTVNAANCSLGSITFAARGSSASDKRGAIIGSNTTADSSSAVSAQMYFYTMNSGSLTTKMLIHPAGVVSVPNGIELGSGIDGTAANTLDDYEEGTFTPYFVHLGTGVHSVQSGTYTKIGRLVTAHVFVQLSQAASGGGQIVVGGMPFTSSSTSLLYGSTSSAHGTSWFTATPGLNGLISQNATNVTFYENMASVGSGYSTSMTDIGTGNLLFTLHYISAL